MNNKRISRIQEFIQMALKIKQICTELTLRQAYYSSAPSKFHWDRQIDEADSTELTLEVRVELCKSESAIYTGLRQTLQGINWPNSLAHIKHQKWAILQEREKSKRSAHVRKIQNSQSSDLNSSITCSDLKSSIYVMQASEIPCTRPTSSLEVHILLF